MSGDPFKAKIEAYTLGLLDEAEARRVEQHLQSCAECKQAWVRLQKAAELIDRGFNQAPPPYLRSKVIAQLKNRRQTKPSWLFWGVPGLIGAAALLLVIKIEPGRMAKQQAMETAPMEQAAPAALPAFESVERKADADKAKISAQPVLRARKAVLEKKPAAPTGPVPARSLMAADKREAEFEAEPQEEVQLPQAPKKARAKAMAPLGGMAGERVSRSDAAAFAPAEAPASDERRAPASAAFRNEKDYKQARALSCILTPADIQGQLNPDQVKSGIAALSQVVTARIVSQGEARVADLRVTIAADGNIQSAAFSSQAFASESLNQFILNQAKLQNFGQPLNSAPATLIIKIDVH